MAFQWILTVFMALAYCLALTRGQGVCIGNTPCYCQFENGQFLDISPLGRKDEEPRFVNISDTHEISYSWNPCFNFTLGDCEDVALCGIEPSMPHDIYHELGFQNDYSFLTNETDNTVSLLYTTPKFKAFIRLVCDRESVNSTYFKAIGPKSQLSPDYYFQLTSPMACPQGTPKVTTTKGPPTTPVDKTKALEGGLIAVSTIAFLLAVALTLAILKIKGKICTRPQYDEL